MLSDQGLKFLMEYLTFINRLDQSDRDLLFRTCSKSTYAPGEIILSKEKECNGLVIVNSGQLRTFFESEDGKEITLYRLLSGDICILTASCVLKNITFEVTLEVEKDSEVTFIPATTWGKLAEKNSFVKEFSRALFRGHVGHGADGFQKHGAAYCRVFTGTIDSGELGNTLHDP